MESHSQDANNAIEQGQLPKLPKLIFEEANPQHFSQGSHVAVKSRKARQVRRDLDFDQDGFEMDVEDHNFNVELAKVEAVQSGYSQHVGPESYLP